MCGRYYRKGSKQQLAAQVRAGQILPGIPDVLDDYNVAPTTHQPVVRHSRDGAERELLFMRWGLVPYFAKSLKDFAGYTTFNAKAESISTSRTWRDPFLRDAAATSGQRLLRVEGSVHRTCPDLDLMDYTVGIGKGDNTAALVHVHPYRRNESEVE